MRHDAVAERYAGTLYELAAEQGDTERVLAQLDRVREVAGMTPELEAALKGAALTNEQKKHLLAECLSEPLPLLIRFFGVVIDHHRAGHVVKIAAAFRALSERKQNIMDVTVRSAVPLSEDELASLRRRLSAMTKATVRLSSLVDPGLIGGLVVEMGDKRIDLSLRARLAGLRQQILAR